MKAPIIFVTVDFADQLASVSRPVKDLETGKKLAWNETAYSNTIQAYVWNRTNPSIILHCQHGPAAGYPKNVNIDTLLEDYKI